MGWTSRLNSRRSLPDIFETSRPSYTTLPVVGLITPSSNRAKVVFPLPLSPATAVIDGRSAEIANEISSTATVMLERLNSPPPNTLVTLCSSSRLANFATCHRYFIIEQVTHHPSVVAQMHISRRQFEASISH